MNNVKVSVIVPVYNCESSLRRCVDSIANQSLREIEIILIDDGSEDMSGTICNQLADKDSRIKVIHQKNAGAGKARNAGLSSAVGEYIGFVDSDDWIDEKMYECMYSVAKKKNLEIVRCNTVIHEKGKDKICWTPNDVIDVCNRDTIRSYVIPTLIAPSKESEWNKRLLRGCVCCIFKNELIRKNDIWFRDIRNGQDYLFTVECMWHANNLILLQDVFYHYIKAESGSLSISIKKFRNYEQRRAQRKIIENLVSGTAYYPIYQSRWQQEERKFVYLDARIATVYNKNATKKEKLKLLKDLLNSAEAKVAFSKPIKEKLPFQLNLLYFLIKHKMYRTLYTAIEYKFKS